MIDQFGELCGYFVYLGCLAAWRSLPIFGIVALLTAILRKRVPARWICWLWLLVVARLLLPISATSPFAISAVGDARLKALLDDNEVNAAVSDEFEVFTYKNEAQKLVSVAIVPDDATAEQKARANVHVAKINADRKSSLEPPEIMLGEAPEPIATESRFEALEPLLFGLSLIVVIGLPLVAVALVTRVLVLHFRLAWRIHCSPTIQERSVVDSLLRVCDDLRVGRRPRIKEADWLHSPAVFGLFSPVVCLPASWREQLTEEQLVWVFRHEVSHIKRRDGLMMFVANLVKSVHWFHPIARIAFTKLQHYMERSADQTAIRNLNETQIRGYGNLLLQYAGNAKGRTVSIPGLVAMASRDGLSERIQAISFEPRSHSRLRNAAMFSLMATLVVIGLTDAITAEQVVVRAQVPDFEAVLANVDWQVTDPAMEGAAESEKRLVNINVQEAVEKVRRLNPGVDAEEFVTTYFSPFSLTADERAQSKVLDGVLRVRATEKQALLIQQRLAAFTQSGLWQIVTELRVIETDIRALNKLNWSRTVDGPVCRRLNRPVLDAGEPWEATFSIDASDWSSRDTLMLNLDGVNSVPVRATKISRLQSELWWHQIQQHNAQSHLLTAPKVTMLNGQCGMISSVVQRPFVTDMVESTSGRLVEWEPKVSVVDEGWKVAIKTTVTKDNHVDLQLVLNHSHVNGVKLASLPYASGTDAAEEVVVQVPTVHSDTVAVASVIGADEALLVFTPKPYSYQSDDPTADRGIGQVFMIRTTLISDDETLEHFVSTQGVAVTEYDDSTSSQAK